MSKYINKRIRFGKHSKIRIRIRKYKCIRKHKYSSKFK